MWLQTSPQGALAPKAVNGREITASELLAFIKAYAKVFSDAVSQHTSGGVVFPEARTLLAATAEANNHNARDAAFRLFKLDMDQVYARPRRQLFATRLLCPVALPPVSLRLDPCPSSIFWTLLILVCRALGIWSLCHCCSCCTSTPLFTLQTANARELF